MIRTLSFFFCSLAFTAQAQITSTFDSNADGWTFLNNGTPVTVNHNATNGNPGGYVSVNYASNATATSQGWFAPDKFLGSQVARSYGMNLHFDMQQAFAGTFSIGQGDVRIQTAGGFTIVFSLPVKPAVAPAWSSYTIALDETGGWRISSTGGALATKADVIRALSDIQSLEIRGSYITNASNVVGIDNVILEQKTMTAAPTIASFAPRSGIPGSSLTITGNNFGATVAQNAVFFGTTKATITSGATTQLNVTVPGGAQYGPITVINLTTGLLVQSIQNYSPLFDNNNDIGGRIIPSSLDLKDNITLDPSHVIQGLSLGDLDGDGLVDIIVSEPGPSTSEVSVFRNLGVTGDINAASFGPRITLGRGYFENAVVDMDGDGKLDIVVLDSFNFNSYFLVYRNISTPGTIAFEAVKSFINPSSAARMHVADIDGDGRPDLLATHPSTGASYYFWILQNLSSPGDILFGAGVVWDNGLFAGSSGISTGDLNGDGKVEIVVAHGATFSIFPNQSTPGTISLGSAFMIDPTNNVTKVEIADLDNDGKPDLIWASANAATAIRIRKNIYSGGAFSASSFDPEIAIAAPGFAADDLTLADMNADGKLDIVATNARDLGIFESNFNGTLSTSSFKQPVLFQGNTFDQLPFKPQIADLDGDNKPDVVSASRSNPTQVFIYRNTCFPAPVINSVSPLTGEAGTSLTVSGNFMNTNFDTPKVKFGSVPATAGSISNTSLSAAIPASAQSDRVSVTLHGLTGFSKPLAVAFPTSRTIDATSFGTPTEFALTNATDGLTIADFDDDGKKDIVVNDNNVVRIFRNTLPAAGSAITTATLTGITTTIAQAAHVTATDIDGDGKTDLIANSAIHRNNSGSTGDAISFEPWIQSVISGANRFAVDHDFNHDGKSDFVITTNGNTYQVNENVSRRGSFTYAGGGVFSTIVNAGIATGAGGQVMGITAGDFDGDGYSDFAFGVSAGTDVLSVVRNTGLNQPLSTAQFETAVTFPALDIPFSIATADFDGDGKPDIVLGNNNAAFISIYRNTSIPGTINFLAKQDIAALSRAIDIKAVDLDGDGKAEIIVAHQPTSTTGSFTVFQNTSTSGTISFAAGINYPLTRGPLALAIADINLDNKPDLIFTVNGATDALLVFENQIVSGPVITISLQPASTAVCEGSTTSFTLTASGTTNLAYQWQKFDGAVFNNVTNGGGYTGATTSTLSINTTGNFGAGDYRCSVSGDLATPVLSQTASLTFTTSTTLAEITANGNTLTASAGDSHQWYHNGNPVSGATNQSYHYNALEYGVYAVAVTSNGCTTTSNDFVYLITGFENPQNGLKIYPNPIAKNLDVEFPPPYTVTIFNTTGKLLKKRESTIVKTSIDFSEIAMGVYILQIKSEKGAFYQRVTKQ